MADEPRSDPGWQENGEDPASTDADAPPAGWRISPAGVYGLEHPLTCPACHAEIDQIYVVRLFRARVNFMSSLPRSGRVLACPKCRSILPGELGAVF
ncbi:MAG: hypothetical protein ABI639_10805 [Thermoanaerobaculia bacterium]